MHNASDPAWLAALARTVPVGIVVIDAQGHIKWCNEQLLAQFRYSEEALRDQPVERLLPERLHRAHAAVRADFIAQPAVRTMGTGRSLHGLRSDGTEFPLEIGLRPLHTGSDTVYMATVVDITARRNAEDSFQRLIEAAPCGMLVLDRSQRIQLVNEQLLTTFGHSRAELLGANLEMLIPERHRAVHREHVAEFARNPATRRMGPGRDLTGLHRDGTEFPVEIGLSPLQLHSGQGVLATVIDVSERKRAEQELRRANADLEEFAYATSHDLRSPLRGIADLAEWITEDLGPEPPASVQNNLKRLKTRVQHMDTLISRMLDYARAGADHGPVESILVESWIREQFEFADPAARARQQISSELPQISVQATPLGIVLRNLIANAVRHNDSDDPEVRVQLQRRGAYYQIDVIDNGPGVMPGSRDRIFKLFQRLKRDPHGTGFGLALVKRTAESHGGSVTVNDRSDGERGARFTVLWPQFTRRPAHA